MGNMTSRPRVSDKCGYNNSKQENDQGHYVEGGTSVCCQYEPLISMIICEHRIGFLLEVECILRWRQLCHSTLDDFDYAKILY